jgi:hypothetical protein
MLVRFPEIKEIISSIKDLLNYQSILAERLARQLNVAVPVLIEMWNNRKIEQTGMLQEKDWEYFFHGLNTVDFYSTSDCREIRLDFGPEGRTDCFTGYGWGIFIMRAVPPWEDYMKAKDYIRDKKIDNSASFSKVLKVFKKIKKRKLIKEIEHEDFKNRYTLV